ncbi:MAG TPA: hypothetical protein VHB20_11685 [Verrucomicrobiae bacterium]|jgi:hypothetical protein|nr:hypothetical protein [Verrucomicrobiae bacterium]
MKTTNYLRGLQVGIIALGLTFGLNARADTARDEVRHAYTLLKAAHDDYHGHKDMAVAELKQAGARLGLDLEGGHWEHEGQLKSDEQLVHARTLLKEARNKLEGHDRELAASQVEAAIKQIDLSLKMQ